MFGRSTRRTYSIRVDQADPSGPIRKIIHEDVVEADGWEAAQAEAEDWAYERDWDVVDAGLDGDTVVVVVVRPNAFG